MKNIPSFKNKTQKQYMSCVFLSTATWYAFQWVYVSFVNKIGLQLHQLTRGGSTHKPGPSCSLCRRWGKKKSKLFFVSYCLSPAFYPRKGKFTFASYWRSLNRSSCTAVWHLKENPMAEALATRAYVVNHFIIHPALSQSIQPSNWSHNLKAGAEAVRCYSAPSVLHSL